MDPISHAAGYGSTNLSAFVTPRVISQAGPPDRMVTKFSGYSIEGLINLFPRVFSGVCGGGEHVHLYGYGIVDKA